MTMVIVAARQRGATFEFVVCPDYSGAVEGLAVEGAVVPFAAGPCGHTAAAHAVYAFPAQEPDGRMATEWAAACAREAYLLAQQTQAAPAEEPLEELLGLG